MSNLETVSRGERSLDTQPRSGDSPTHLRIVSAGRAEQLAICCSATSVAPPCHSGPELRAGGRPRSLGPGGGLRRGHTEGGRKIP
jgi:hypothetical protein